MKQFSRLLNNQLCHYHWENMGKKQQKKSKNEVAGEKGERTHRVAEETSQTSQYHIDGIIRRSPYNEQW
jgi:hypothetical protein